MIVKTPDETVAFVHACNDCTVNVCEAALVTTVTIPGVTGPVYDYSNQLSLIQYQSEHGFQSFANSLADYKLRCRIVVIKTT